MIQFECLDFKLTCNCGEEIDGSFYGDDFTETLHCRCGKIWIIGRPYETKPNAKEGTE